jgi:O6-methylguanine-DNA--protein-cysteine methyltransferase
MTSFQIPVTGTVFCTELGWVSICWNEEKVCQISFGHPNKTQALRRLLCKESPHSHLTPAQKELANRIEDYAAGEVVDFSDVELDFGK